MAIPAVVVSENDVIDGIVAILETNKSSYVSGYVFQNVAMELPQIEWTPLVAPETFPFIGVDVTNTQYSAWPEFIRSTGRDKPLMGEFDVEMIVAQHAVVEYGETSPMDTAHRQFRGMIQRIVKSIYDNYEFVYNSKTFKLSEERIVRVNNLTEDWTTTTGYEALMMSQISYTLLCRCQ